MISKTSVHAIRALAEMAKLEENTYIGTSALAEQVEAPRNYLGKLLQMFVHEGLVYSQKGMGGGFQLARKPSQISLLDVVEPIEHISQRPNCFLGNKECSETSPCVMHHRWKKVRDFYIKFLCETTLADFLQKNQKDQKHSLIL